MRELPVVKWITIWTDQLDRSMYSEYHFNLGMLATFTQNMSIEFVFKGGDSD